MRDENDRRLTVEEACKRLGIHRATLHDAFKAGRISRVKGERGVRYWQSEVDRYGSDPTAQAPAPVDPSSAKRTPAHNDGAPERPTGQLPMSARDAAVHLIREKAAADKRAAEQLVEAVDPGRERREKATLRAKLRDRTKSSVPGALLIPRKGFLD